MTNTDKIDNKNIFKKVAEKAVEGVQKVAEKTIESESWLKTIDKFKATLSSRRLGRHDIKSAEAMAKARGFEEESKSLAKKNEEGERRVANLEEKYKNSHGDILSKIKAEFLKEEKKNERTIDNLKKKRDQAEAWARKRENKKIVCENKTKDIVSGVLYKVEKRLNPHEIKLENIKGRIDTLSSEAKNFESVKVKLGEKVENLKKELETSEFKAEKKGIKRMIGEIENEIRKTEKIRLGRLGERSKMENKWTKINKKADKWRNIHDEFARLTQRGVEHKNIEKRGAEKPDLKNVEIGDKKKRTKKEAGSGSESSSEREPTFSLEEYVENWNKYFGSQFKIDSKLFLEEALEKKMEIPFLEDHIRMIYKKKREADKSSVGSFSERDLEKSLKSLNNYL